MAKDHIVDYDTTAGNNTDVDGVSVAEGTAPSNINDAIREQMADLAELYGDIGGSLVSAGSNGAYTLTTNDSVAAYAQKQFYLFEANHAMPDTVTATLNVNAIGAKALRKHVSLNLGAGDIAVNQMVAVVYEGTNDCFHVLNPVANDSIVTVKSGALAYHEALAIKNNATNPTYQVDVDADAVLLEAVTSTGYKRVTSVNLTVDLTASGANGLDTGAEANSTWYHIWVIAQADGTTAGLLSTSATAPTMPATYIYRGYVGAIYNDSGGNLSEITQKGIVVGIEQDSIVSSGSATSLTSVDASAKVPTTANILLGVGVVNNGTGGSAGLILTVGPNDSAENVGVAQVGATIDNGGSARAPIRVVMETAQTVYYEMDAAGGKTGSIFVTGWEF